MTTRLLAWFALWQTVTPRRDAIDDIPLMIAGFVVSEVVFRWICSGHAARR